ncbi:MAG: bifunctional precorrin-2 dehydrogenase/sirohydrochlorin ferrochelatase [Dysgonamonadaceae bacterium]|jgi:siroheme synthase-like protein|nr:bifunctional precorrin-2 dehydrogenase/sirohydrochlorin ferrochelatase [Dysgonamonadaceae bacterium]
MSLPSFLPISINIAGKKILLIGGGNVAFHKASLLLRYTNDVTVIAPEFHAGFDALPFRLIKKKYEPDDLNGAFLVYLCTENEELNVKIKSACENRKILTSVCDNPQLCDFVSPAIYKEDYVSIAVSSNAQNVRQSIAVRDQIQKLAADGVLQIK